jgi:hypothetical protein
VVGPLLEERAARLDEARALLARSTRAWGGAGPGRAADPEERMLPLAEPLRPLLPGGGLRRGSTVEVGRCTALTLALLAEASAGGAWCALVGLPEVGLVAAEEAGLALSRLALVPRPGPDLVPVTGALLDGLDLVVVAGGQGLPAGARQRLAARARQRGSVLLPVGPWPGAEVRLEVGEGRWLGLDGGGAGRLRARRVTVRGGGRGAAHRGRAVTVLLPGPDGAVASASAPGGPALGGPALGGPVVDGPAVALGPVREAG